MKAKITKHLTEKPSYLKWGAKRLAAKFGCSERTIKSITKNLTSVKSNYIASI